MIKISKNFHKLIVLSLFFLIFSLLANQASAAVSWVQTSQIDFEAGTLTNIDTTTSSGQLRLTARTDLAENKWASTAEISTATDTQQYAKIVADGSGGAIIAWQDARNGTDLDIYAQKINSSGTVQWTSNGTAISTATDRQADLKIVTDGSGGAIIIWIDDRNTTNDIYAQRINSSGTVLWTSDGIRLTNTGSARINMSCISDGAGGAIIAWEDNRGSDINIYAQRINSSGSSQWTSNGVVITNATNDQLYPQIASDGGSGAIIAWQDSRGTDENIYAQKINSSGTVQWTANGIVISNAANDQTTPEIIEDNSSNAIIVWSDYRNGNSDIYAQKVDTDGDVSWTANGVVITTESGDQKYPALTTNGEGGAIIAWVYDTGFASDELYTQNIDSTGVVQWEANGEYVSGAVMNTFAISIISDGAQGAILSWDYNHFGINEYEVFAQKINTAPDGSFYRVWTDGGSSTAFLVATCSASNPSPVIASDANGGAIAAWEDVDGDENIYAQKFGTKLEYLTPGTYISPIYDSGGVTKFSDLKWTENLPVDTDITFQTRTADALIATWVDNFDDGNVSNVSIGAYTWPDFYTGSFDWPPTEPSGVLTFVDPQPVSGMTYDDYYITIDTGMPEDYFPGGSTVTANVTIITEAEPELYMFVDDWEIDSQVTTTTNSEVEIIYISASDEPFNTIGFDLYGLDHQAIDDDQFLINSLTIEPPAGSANFSDWSAEMTSPLGNGISDSTNRYIQIKANLTTTDDTQTPTINDVTLYMGLSGDVNITANIEPTLSLLLSSDSCDLGIMTESDLNTCSYNITVNTNGTNGYNANIRQDAGIHSGTNILEDVSGGIGTITAGTEGYGFATSNSAYIASGYYIPAPPDVADCESYAGQHAVSAPAKALTDADFTVAEADDPVNNDSTTICHIAAVSGSTPAGTYSHTIIITVIGNF